METKTTIIDAMNAAKDSGYFKKESDKIKEDQNFLCGLEIPEYGFNVYLTYIGGEKVKYDVYKDGKPLFSGKDFKPSPFYNQDSLECIVSLLGFICLKPGDTDREYFDKYTESQLNWANSAECEQIGIYVSDFEDSDSEHKQEALDFLNARFIQ